MHGFVQAIISGLVLGGTYAIISVGLALIFGVMRVVNFAQAAFMMIAMYATLSITQWTGLDPFATLPIVGPIFFVGAWAVYRLALKRVTGRRYAHDGQIMLTLGLGVVLQALALMVYGANPRSISTGYSAKALRLGGYVIDLPRLYAFCLALVFTALLFLFLHRTILGTALRAAADDWEASGYMGINVERMQALAFSLGIALTAVGGVALSTFQPFDPSIGDQYIIIMFVAVVFGGLGSIGGALLGGLTVGILQLISQWLWPAQLSDAVVFGVFLVVLIVRPQGMFGRKERVI